MNKKLVTAFSIAYVICALAGVSHAQGKSIYGTDNRAELFEVSSDKKLMADSIVSLWRAPTLELLGNVTFSTKPLGEKKNLCPGEKFADQPTGAFCSGSLVGEDIVMTAGHCITDQAKCDSTKVVFGFAVKAKGAKATGEFSSSQVYSCKEIIKRELVAEEGPKNKLDFALIRLDRKVTGHKPLAVNRKTSASAGTELFVMGHPSGLPLKIAGGAKVRSAEGDKPYFMADLDTFGGNSGSAVFNAKTNLIEGILVRGDTDYSPSPTGDCNITTAFPQDGGTGESVTKISELRDFIPRNYGTKSGTGNKAAPVGRPLTGLNTDSIGFK